MMDAESTGLVSKDELEKFLKFLAPPDMSIFDIWNLAKDVMSQVDKDASGLISWAEFDMWPGKHTLLDWVDAFHARVLSRYNHTAHDHAIATESHRVDYRSGAPKPIPSPSYG